MSIEERAAKEAREVLDWFERVQSLGRDESMSSQKQSFLTLALINFARREQLLHRGHDG